MAENENSTEEIKEEVTNEEKNNEVKENEEKSELQKSKSNQMNQMTDIKEYLLNLKIIKKEHKKKEKAYTIQYQGI